MNVPTHPHSDEILIDPHTHSRFSDGPSTPHRMFMHARRRGLRGIIITDHDTVRHWHSSLEAAKHHEMITCMGVEVSSAQGHILAYFDNETPARKVARALSLDEGTIHYMEAKSIFRRVRELGGMVCVPHPYGPFYPLGGRYFNEVDGIEEYNSWIFQDNKSFHNAFGAGKKHKVAALGASDSHYPYTLGFGATAIPTAVDISKPDWFLHCLRQKLTRPIVQQKTWHRRINVIKSTVSIPLNMRYNVKFFRSKWRGYWKQNYKAVLARGLKPPGDNNLL